MTSSADGGGAGARRWLANACGLTRELGEAFLIAVLFALFVRTFVFQAFRIPSSSMEQNLLVGDHILVNKFVYSPGATAVERLLLPERRVERGDVVVFRFPRDPSRDFIKRCLGLPGDVVELRDKHLLINGRPLAESAYAYFAEDHSPRAPGYQPRGLVPRDNMGPLTVPPGEYFCLGDNRDLSNDSRFWGTVPARFVKGRALLIYWSSVETAASDLPAPPAAGLWARLRRLLAATRWERCLRVVR